MNTPMTYDSVEGLEVLVLPRIARVLAEMTAAGLDDPVGVLRRLQGGIGDAPEARRCRRVQAGNKKKFASCRRFYHSWTFWCGTNLPAGSQSVRLTLRPSLKGAGWHAGCSVAQPPPLRERQGGSPYGQIPAHASVVIPRDTRRVGGTTGRGHLVHQRPQRCHDYRLHVGRPHVRRVLDLGHRRILGGDRGPGGGLDRDPDRRQSVVSTLHHARDGTRGYTPELWRHGGPRPAS